MANFSTKMRHFLSDIQDGMYALGALYEEKGISLLRLPLMVLIAAPIIIWILLYKPAVTSYKYKLKTLSSLTAQKEYGADFKNIFGKISEYEKSLFNPKDTPDKLSSIIRQMFSEEGISIQSMGRQNESNIEKNYLAVSTDIKFLADFEKAAKVIAKLESSPYFIKLTRIEMSKLSTREVGQVSVSMRVETIFTRNGLGGNV